MYGNAPEIQVPLRNTYAPDGVPSGWTKRFNGDEVSFHANEVQNVAPKTAAYLLVNFPQMVARADAQVQQTGERGFIFWSRPEKASGNKGGKGYQPFFHEERPCIVGRNGEEKKFVHGDICWFDDRELQHFQRRVEAFGCEFRPHEDRFEERSAPGADGRSKRDGRSGPDKWRAFIRGANVLFVDAGLHLTPHTKKLEAITQAFALARAKDGEDSTYYDDAVRKLLDDNSIEFEDDVIDAHVKLLLDKPQE